jgi:hypothetical protein
MSKNKLVIIILNININISTYIVIPRKASWFIAVQASKVREKLPLLAIFSNNSSLIKFELFSKLIFNSSVNTLEYKVGTSL